MKLKKITLQNFRSYSQKEFEFEKGTTLIVGPNASGKTNLLEAIRLLSLGQSVRANLEREMVRNGQDTARISGIIRSHGEDKELVVFLAEKKSFLINNVRRRRMDFSGEFLTVYFGPEDLEIIIGSPAIRRKYLDAVLEPIDRDYRRAVLSYEKGLRQRNKLLEVIRDQGKPASSLYFWDKLLLENGMIISQKREELISFFNQQPSYFDSLRLFYLQNLISPQRLVDFRPIEIAAGMTLVGPHRDDFKIEIGKEEHWRNLHIFGSRGEQRTAIFSLKLAELAFVKTKTSLRPVLLLDDIFSELDHEHRKRLLEVIPKQQTIITTTDLHVVESEERKKMALVKL